MNYFWGNLFERFKERENTVFFFWGLALLPFLILLGAIGLAIFQGCNLAENWPMTLPGFFLFVAVLVWRGVRRERARRLHRYQVSPLSRDELAKARSKLKTSSTIKFKS